MRSRAGQSERSPARLRGLRGVGPLRHRLVRQRSAPGLREHVIAPRRVATYQNNDDTARRAPAGFFVSTNGSRGGDIVKTKRNAPGRPRGEFPLQGGAGCRKRRPAALGSTPLQANGGAS